MPKRPPTSAYARLTQTETDLHDLSDEEYDDPRRAFAPLVSSPGHARDQPDRRADRMTTSGLASPSGPPGRRGRQGRSRRNSGVDIKHINARLERWAEEIAAKFKLRRGARFAGPEQLEIQHSVFQAPDWIRPATVDSLETYPDTERMTKDEFDAVVESVRVAIENGIHPKLISQGSSGSYFARNSQGDVLGVFKPKDEEPYASKNPKWTKWIHRNLFPFFFGRACLIPNLSYVSEAAAYVLDTQLRCGLVPYTDVVGFSSKSFSYDFWDRRSFYRKKKPLPEKLGSLQVFLKGYKDATQFFKEHPWPDQSASNLQHNPRKKKRRWAEDCRPGGSLSDDEEDGETPATVEEEDRRRVFWTEKLQSSFREQLERLVILDYIMRNTDRGLDNWMIRIDREEEEAKVVLDVPQNGQVRSSEEPYRRPFEQMVASSRSATPLNQLEEKAAVRIGAIDNSLSWPWKHPDAWRSYPFGWLFLPVSLIGQPFTTATRNHFLPLLTSKAWWSETQLALRRVFTQDVDFQEKMYAKQIAVMKGQAWNVVETLKTPDHGPLELTRRARVFVWDDLVEVPVVVPLRATSSEQRRRNQEETGDVAAQAPDLLGFGDTPDAENPNPFNVSRQSSAVDVRAPLPPNTGSHANGTLSPPNIRSLADSVPDMRAPLPSRPMHRPNQSRTSFDSARESPRKQHRRRLSHQYGRLGGSSARHERAGPSSYRWDDDEGDLGFAAVGDREHDGKMVIVERLEMVKSKNPVFTWC